MSGKLRQLRTTDVLRILAGFGFEEVRGGKGSHIKLRRMVDDKRQTLILPRQDPLARGTLRAIFRQACRYVAESELRPHFFTD